VAGLTAAELATIRRRLETFVEDLFASLPRADQRAARPGRGRGRGSGVRRDLWPRQGGQLLAQRGLVGLHDQQGRPRRRARPPVDAVDHAAGVGRRFGRGSRADYGTGGCQRGGQSQPMGNRRNGDDAEQPGTAVRRVMGLGTHMITSGVPALIPSSAGPQGWVGAELPPPLERGGPVGRRARTDGSWPPRWRRRGESACSWCRSGRGRRPEAARSPPGSRRRCAAGTGSGVWECAKVSECFSERSANPRLGDGVVVSARRDAPRCHPRERWE
jgi:hypothetical protein